MELDESSEKSGEIIDELKDTCAVVASKVKCASVALDEPVCVMSPAQAEKQDEDEDAQKKWPSKLADKQQEAASSQVARDTLSEAGENKTTVAKAAEEPDRVADDRDRDQLHSQECQQAANEAAAAARLKCVCDDGIRKSAQADNCCCCCYSNKTTTAAAAPMKHEDIAAAADNACKWQNKKSTASNDVQQVGEHKEIERDGGELLDNTQEAALDEGEPDLAGRRADWLADKLAPPPPCHLSAASSAAQLADGKLECRPVAHLYRREEEGAIRKTNKDCAIKDRKWPNVRLKVDLERARNKSKKMMIETMGPSEMKLAPIIELTRPPSTMNAGVRPTGELDALLASQKLASDCQDEVSNLLDVLQILSKRRDELRLADKQLLELIGECYLRLDSPLTVASSSNEEVLDQKEPINNVELAPIDLTQANQRQQGEKRVKILSPGVNFKKIRLLGGAHSPLNTQSQQQINPTTNHLNSPPTICQVPNAMPQTQPKALETVELIKTATYQHSKSIEMDEQADERPELRKFCSLGSAEISREQFCRQQQMFDLTLAKLARDSQAPEFNQQQPPPPGGDNRQLIDFYLAAAATPKPQLNLNEARNEFNQQQQQYLNGLAMAASSFKCQWHAPPPPQAISELPNDQHLCQPKQQQPSTETQLQLATIGHHQNHHITQAGRPSAFDQLLRNSAANICHDLAPIVRKMAFKCHVCQNCFEDRHRLQQHLSIHLNLHPSWFEEKIIKETMAAYESRRGDYLCHLCQVRYETTPEFDKHMHLHGYKPHQCNLCSRDSKFVSFRYFRQLLTHLRTHCFLYSCKFAPECRQTANRKDYLKLHILKHHLNNKLPEQFTICCH